MATGMKQTHGLLLSLNNGLLYFYTCDSNSSSRVQSIPSWQEVIQIEDKQMVVGWFTC